MMERAHACRSLSLSVLLLGALLCAGPAAATTFTVHGWELGEKIDLTDGRRVWTAILASS